MILLQEAVKERLLQGAAHLPKLQRSERAERDRQGSRVEFDRDRFPSFRAVPGRRVEARQSCRRQLDVPRPVKAQQQPPADHVARRPVGLLPLPSLAQQQLPRMNKPCGAGLFFSFCLACIVCQAQSLTPRAYVITPVQWNAFIVSYSFYDGSVLFDGAVPITGAKTRVNVPTFSYYHAFNFFGRSANITASLPYGVGHYQGRVIGVEREAYRSGLLDAEFRFSVNLKGGPAMTPEEFRS